MRDDMLRHTVLIANCILQRGKLEFAWLSHVTDKCAFYRLATTSGYTAALPVARRPRSRG